MIQDAFHVPSLDPISSVHHLSTTTPLHSPDRVRGCPLWRCSPLLLLLHSSSLQTHHQEQHKQHCKSILSGSLLSRSCSNRSAGIDGACLPPPPPPPRLPRSTCGRISRCKTAAAAGGCQPATASQPAGMSNIIKQLFRSVKKPWEVRERVGRDRSGLNPSCARICPPAADSGSAAALCV